MNRRPIGLNHGEHCDSGDPEFMCDECRDGAEPTCPACGFPESACSFEEDPS